MAEHEVMALRSAYLAGWITVTAVATTVGMGTVAVVRGAVGDPSSVATLSESEISGDDRIAAHGIGPSGSVGPSTSPSSVASKGPSIGTHSTGPSPGSGVHPSNGSNPSHSAPAPSVRPSTGPTHHPTAEPTTTPSPTTGPTPVFRSLVSPGGSVLARCTGDVIYVVSASPGQGYRVLIETRGGEEAEVKFQGTTEIGVQIQCVKGVPTQNVESSDY